MEYGLPCRRLGGTGLEVSVLGLGGFHQVEALQETVDEVVDRYLEAGGSYVETACGYGRGASEFKLGRALVGRRDRVVLASKSNGRTREDAWRDINESLERLQTDRFDLYFFHNIGTREMLDATCADDGAVHALLRARDEGMIGHIAMSSHWPELYVEAAGRLPIEAVLVWGNYLDFCNFPEIPNRVLPELRRRDIGVIFMKPLADGYLYRSPREALRYALSRDVDCVVAGFNSVAQLETDLAACCDPSPVTDEEVERILESAPELGTYVCRQCAVCTVADDGDGLKRIFELEGKFDRQMDDRLPTDAAHYALRERLKGWFQAQGRARQRYAGLKRKAPEFLGEKPAPCRYGLDVPRKLRIVHAKLSPDERIEVL